MDSLILFPVCRRGGRAFTGRKHGGKGRSEEGDEGAGRGGVTAVRVRLNDARGEARAFVVGRQETRMENGGCNAHNKRSLSFSLFLLVCPGRVVTCRYAPYAEPSVR